MPLAQPDKHRQIPSREIVRRFGQLSTGNSRRAKSSGDSGSSNSQPGRQATSNTLYAGPGKSATVPLGSGTAWVSPIPSPQSLACSGPMCGIRIQLPSYSKDEVNTLGPNGHNPSGSAAPASTPARNRQATLSAAAARARAQARAKSSGDPGQQQQPTRPPGHQLPYT
jgi:hypothetical protein